MGWGPLPEHAPGRVSLGRDGCRRSARPRLRDLACERQQRARSAPPSWCRRSRAPPGLALDGLGRRSSRGGRWLLVVVESKAVAIEMEVEGEMEEGMRAGEGRGRGLLKTRMGETLHAVCTPRLSRAASRTEVVPLGPGSVARLKLTSIRRCRDRHLRHCSATLL
ncbi:unnamed protein product [Diplocarpon coronariae]